MYPFTAGRRSGRGSGSPHDAGRPLLFGDSLFLPHNHVWHVDLTTMPTARSWAPWLPFAFRQVGPFRLRIAAMGRGVV